MNKSYFSLVVIVCLAINSCSLSATPIEKPCKPNSLQVVVKKYILAHIALYTGIPVISAGMVMALGSAPLKHSRGVFRDMNCDMGKALLKTMPITASLAVLYNTYCHKLHKCG